MPSILIDGTKIALRVEGGGEPVILLHSSACSSRQWQGVQDQLGPGYRFLVPDLYGYGASQPWSRTRPMRLADEAAIVKRLLPTSHEPVHLIGHSYGGSVALSAALALGDRLASLTLIEPTVFHLLGADDPVEGPYYREIETLAGTCRSAVRFGQLDRGMRHFVNYWNGPDAWYRLTPGQRTALSSRLSRVVLNFAAARHGAPGRKDYQSIMAPCLILCGTRSPAPVRHLSRILTEIMPNARHRTLSNLGHMAPLTHPQRVASVIADHMARHSAISSADFRQLAA